MSQTHSDIIYVYILGGGGVFVLFFFIDTHLGLVHYQEHKPSHSVSKIIYLMEEKDVV
jgi:hypothetical protein